MTHFSPECYKKLKEFLGSDAPEPMDRKYWFISNKHEDYNFTSFKQCGQAEADEFCTIYKFGIAVPFYQLHDVLSKPFCEAMANKKISTVVTEDILRIEGEVIMKTLSLKYYRYGLEAAEKELMRMMEGK